MKVTKYPQSCLLLEKNDQRIVIDPGGFFAAAYSADVLGDVAAVLYTHQHGDHYDENLARQFLSRGIPIFGNSAVAALVGEKAKKVVDGETFNIAGFDVLPHDLPHFQKAGVEMPQNTGYVIDDHFFHPGDGVINNGVHTENLAAPIAGPFDFQTILTFISSVGAKKVIPIHYSNQELYPCDPDSFIQDAQNIADIIYLENGQSVEL